MTFGEALREARESRGWSRARLVIAVRARMNDRTLTFSYETVKDLEGVEGRSPRETTFRILARVFPELMDHYPPKPPRASRETVAA